MLTHAPSPSADGAARNRAPAVSVVTPFYNSADTLGECIESVLAQSHDQFEYILADNCSTDGSAEIAERYAKQDPRIRFLRFTEFVGQIPNYNRTIRHMSPEAQYCKIVQADDMIFPQCLTEMVAVGEEHPTVGIVSALSVEGSKIKNAGLPYPSRFIKGTEICQRQLLTGEFFFGSQTAVLYRAELVRERGDLFEDGKLHPDTELCYEALKRWDFGFVHQVLSIMRERDEGISAGWRSYNPHLLDRYIILNLFGSHYLAADAMRARLARMRRDYHAYLGLSWLHRREPEFWAHHRRGLATIGESFTSGELVVWAAGVVAREPLRALRRLVAGRARA